MYNPDEAAQKNYEDIYDSDNIVRNYQYAIASTAHKALKDNRSPQEIDVAEAEELTIVECMKSFNIVDDALPENHDLTDEKRVYREKLRENAIQDYEPQNANFLPTKGVNKSIDKGVATQNLPEFSPLPMVLPPDTVLMQEGTEIIITKRNKSQQPPPILYAFCSANSTNSLMANHLVNFSSLHHETIASTSIPNPEKRQASVYPEELKDNKNFNYISPEGKEVEFDRGHGIDFQHGNGATTYCRENYTPQNPTYNRHIRQGLIKEKFKDTSGWHYSEIAIYSNDPKITKNGTKIPEGFIFNILDEKKNIKESYYFSNWDTKKEYDKYPKEAKNQKTKEFVADYRIKELDILTPIIYDKNKSHEDHFKEIQKKFLEAINILEEFKKNKNPIGVGMMPDAAKDALFQFIILNLLEQAGSLEYYSTYYRCNLVQILLGVSKITNSIILRNENRAKELLDIIEKQMLQELELLTFHKKSPIDASLVREDLGQQPSEKELKRAYHEEQDEYWDSNEYLKMMNQMIDLYRLYSKCCGSDEAVERIYKRIEEEVSAAREEGCIVLCNTEPARYSFLAS